MLLYFALAFTLFPLTLYCSSKEYQINDGTLAIGKTTLFLFISITIILGGIRWKTGADWTNYYNYFYNNQAWDEFYGKFEISYAFLNFFIKKYFGTYTVLLFFMSFAVIFLRYNTIKVIAIYPALSYYFFFCDNIGGMFPVRQTLAIAIALTSIYFIHKKNKKAFILITTLAVTFHMSLFIWFISYPLYHKKIRTSTILLLLIVATIIGMFGTKLFTLIVEATLARFQITGAISTKIQIYILGNYSDGSFSLFRMLLSFIKRLVFVLLFLFLRNKLTHHYLYASGLINLYLISNIIYSLFAFNEALAPMARMVTPFLFLEVLLFPAILKLCKHNYSKYILLYLFFFYGLMKLHSALTTYPDAFMPYKSIIS